MRKHKCLAIFITLVMVITILTLMAAPIFAADDDVVPDMNLRWKINNKLGVANPCAPISRAQMESLTGYLGANNPAVTSLEGLQYAKNLSELYLDSNNISNISPLSGMANLRLVDLSGNQISDLRPLSGLTKLTLLCIQCNQVSDLSPLSRMTNLTSLSLDDNQISDISPLSGLTNLTWLTLGENQISDISPLSGLTNLKTLDLRYNQISDIRHLSGLTNLIHLRLGNNQISDISSLSGMTNMSSMLELNDNQISDISPLSGLTNLRNLDLHCNQISDINPLSGITNLAWLCLEKNQISDLRPLSRLTNKGSIYAKDQNISLSVGGAMVPNPLIAIDGTVVPITENANVINANNNQIKILSYDSMTDPVTVQFSDRRTKTYEFSGQLEISKGSETNAPAITTTNLTGGTVGTAYSETLAATGDTPITWSIESGSLPAGLSLEASTGVISGTPATVGTASFTVKATNAAGSDTKALSIDITAEVTITYGDVNDDGTIDITDAVRVLKHITAPSTLNVQQQIAANVSGDGIIDITDAVLILKHITSPTTPFPVEKL